MLESEGALWLYKIVRCTAQWRQSQGEVGCVELYLERHGTMSLARKTQAMPMSQHAHVTSNRKAPHPLPGMATGLPNSFPALITCSFRNRTTQYHLSLSLILSMCLCLILCLGTHTGAHEEVASTCQYPLRSLGPGFCPWLFATRRLKLSIL